ncbi:MAG: hypothetical protein ABFR90_10840 [Planctomycetota bacterium]
MAFINKIFLIYVFVCVIPVYAEKEISHEERPPGYTGKCKTIKSDGSVYESEFVKGIAHGKNFDWGASGRLVREGYYLHGKSHGAWTFYDTDGDIQFVRIKEKGKISREIHYDNGKIIADGQYKDGKRWNGIFRA